MALISTKIEGQTKSKVESRERENRPTKVVGRERERVSPFAGSRGWKQICFHPIPDICTAL